MELITKQGAALSSGAEQGRSMPKGYKQTEIGIIPEDWDACHFEDVLDGFSSGMTPYRGTPEFYRGNIPWITSGELNYNVVTDTHEKITQDAVVKTNLKILPVGTFLMAITGLEAAGTRGSCGITGIEATTNQSCMALFPKIGKIDSKYLYHFYVQYGNELAFKFCQGTKQQSYTGRIAKILPINLPPTLTEQKAIATALSDVDALISHLDQIISKKKAIKQGAMQELLTGKTRLKGFEGSGRFKQTEVGRIPVEWEVSQLQIVAELTSSKRIFEDDYVQSGVPFYRGMEISLIAENKEIDKPYYITEEKYESIKNKFGAPKKDDILVTAVGTLGNIYLVPDDNKFYFKDGNLIWLRKVSKVVPVFLKFFLEYNRKIILDSAIGSSQKALTIIALKNLPVILPPTLTEQKAIATVLSEMDADIALLESKKAKYQDIKQGMMQELLTGKTRLV